MFFIILGFSLLPKFTSDLLEAWRQKHNFDSYRSRRSHVVVSFGALDAAILEEFLLEFYANNGGLDGNGIQQCVVVLSPDELTTEAIAVTSMPQWNHRIVYVRGSAMVPRDLDRAQISKARACFILGEQPTTTLSPEDADSRTILRAWAVNDHAPKVPLFTMLALAENRQYIKHLPGVSSCADEIRTAMLALGCRFRGANTLITTLVHTAPEAPIEKKESKKKLQDFFRKHESSVQDAFQYYADSSRADIFSIKLTKDTPLLKNYIGMPFAEAGA